jgi:eukaryotic-like serine/threonine-protein kinase
MRAGRAENGRRDLVCYAPTKPMASNSRRVGRYVIFGPIASGGMGTVCFGRLLGAEGFSRAVAIKRVRAELAGDQELVTGLMDEAKIAARIRHPNVVPTLDVESDGGEIFVIMEYVAGASLAHLLVATKEQQEAMPIGIAIRVMIDTLRGLHAAHEACDELGKPLGIVHRDVSPQNVLVGADGVARVVDFGVAKAEGRSSKTRAGQLKGKLRYMAPEQLLIEPVGPHTDIYAASAVLWEALTGEVLVQGERQEMIRKILQDPIPPPSNLRPEICPELDALVLRGLAREPRRRHASARAFAQALESTGLASSSGVVEEWVRLVVGDILQLRSELLRSIEQTPLVGIEEVPTKPIELAKSEDHAAAFEGTLPIATTTSPVAVPKTPRRSLATIVITLVLALAAGAPLLWLTTRSPEAVRDEPPIERAKEAAAPVHAEPPAPVELEPAVVAAPPSEKKPVERRARPRKKRGPEPAPSCDPPYWIDGSGIRRVKEECL